MASTCPVTGWRQKAGCGGGARGGMRCSGTCSIMWWGACIIIIMVVIVVLPVAVVVIMVASPSSSWSSSSLCRRWVVGWWKGLLSQGPRRQCRGGVRHPSIHSAHHHHDDDDDGCAWVDAVAREKGWEGSVAAATGREWPVGGGAGATTETPVARPTPLGCASACAPAVAAAPTGRGIGGKSLPVGGGRKRSSAARQVGRP